MTNEMMKYNEAVFEDIKHVNENGQEFWYARELQKVLGYTEFGKFLPAIKRAMAACEQSGNHVNDHFAHVSEMITIGKGGERELPSYQLSRYACYLIVMNGDSRKEVIALGQTYFAVKPQVHYEVGRKVRNTIAELGGTMPEDLPTPDKSIKQLEREESKKAEQLGNGGESR